MHDINNSQMCRMSQPGRPDPHQGTCGGEGQPPIPVMDVREGYRSLDGITRCYIYAYTIVARYYIERTTSKTLYTIEDYTIGGVKHYATQWAVPCWGRTPLPLKDYTMARIDSRRLRTSSPILKSIRVLLMRGESV